MKTYTHATIADVEALARVGRMLDANVESLRAAYRAQHAALREAKARRDAAMRLWAEKNAAIRRLLVAGFTPSAEQEADEKTASLTAGELSDKESEAEHANNAVLKALHDAMGARDYLAARLTEATEYGVHAGEPPVTVHTSIVDASDFSAEMRDAIRRAFAAADGMRGASK